MSRTPPRRPGTRPGPGGVAPAPRARPATAATPAPPLPLRHPAALLAIALAALSIVISVSFLLFEKDMWQHIAVGRALWQLRYVPTTQIWIWPTYGTPDVTPSWLFRALLWPVWEHGGVLGLFVVRWVTTLAAFGLAWATARRIGARGLTPLLVMAVCALTYRQRSQVRPEILAAVLLALQIWLLERRRHGGPDHGWALIPIAWAWANAHISYPLGFALTGIHLLFARPVAGRGALAGRRGLAIVLAGQVAISLLHPGGLPALRQPFTYVLAERDDPIMRTIPELYPVAWSANLADLLPLVLLGWLALAIRHWRRAGFDAVEALTVGGAVGLALPSHRFLGFAMIAIAPYLARDLDAWVAARRWPAWSRAAWTRGALAGTACLVAGIAEWARPELPLGIGIQMREVPVHGCDWIAAHGVRGRGFNAFYHGGYLLYRFWPDRGRLPFMDIHQSGTARDRYQYTYAGWDARAWRDLDRRHRFDWVLWRRQQYGSERLLDVLDADSSFALVFLDDAAALYLRRGGAHAALADSFAYRVIPAGPGRWGRLGVAAPRDPALRAAILAELEREVAGSPEHALARTRLGAEALTRGELADARRHLEDALRVNPRAPRTHERLAIVALLEGRPRDALDELARERRIAANTAALEMLEGRAWRALGDAGRARAHWSRAIRMDPGFAEAADSLRALEGSQG